MTTYTCGKMRPIKTGTEFLGRRNRYGIPAWELTVESASDAAKIFARRIAQEDYGSRGFCHHVRQDCRYQERDGTISSITFEAMIGVPWERHGCSGQNIWLTVHITDQEETP